MNSERANELINKAKESSSSKGYGRWRNIVASLMTTDEVSFLMKLVKKEKDALDVVLVNIARGYKYE
jgi:hypothetical protein